jgi:hypothetical protein
MARLETVFLRRTIKTAREISSKFELMKRLAKYLMQQWFRNTMLQDLHAGITPNSQTGDYTDVVARSPYGEIPGRDFRGRAISK